MGDFIHTSTLLQNMHFFEQYLWSDLTQQLNQCTGMARHGMAWHGMAWHGTTSRAPVGVQRLEEHEHEDGGVEHVRQDRDPPTDLHLGMMHLRHYLHVSFHDFQPHPANFSSSFHPISHLIFSLVSPTPPT